MVTPPADLGCPFCAYTSKDSYMLLLHVEERHTDDSPFVVKEAPDAAAQLTEPSPGRQPTWRTSVGNDVGSDADQEYDDGGAGWMPCPNSECDEQIHIEDLDEHLDLHYAEGLVASQQQGHSAALPHSTSQPSNGEMPSDEPEDGRRRHHRSRHHHEHRQFRTNSRSEADKSTISRTARDLSASTSGKKHKKKESSSRSVRLGKSELGPYAYEDRMPSTLYKQLQAGPKVSVVNRIGHDGRLTRHEVIDNETPAVLPVLAQLCAIDRDVSQAWLCHPSTIHIYKRTREGGFCGYRNIQMLVSYMQGAKAPGHAHFPPRTPGILVLQDLIEQAWDMGINEVSRLQTGGIKGTRKYIGTPEVQALFQSLGIDHGLQIFSDRPGTTPQQAHEQLLDYVKAYFRAGSAREQREKKVVRTHLPPIYLQQPGHSVTIVGYEQRKDGARNLLVFDPMFRTSPGMAKILGRRDLRTPRPEVMQAYRRGGRQLKRHRDYELLALTAPCAPLYPAWDV
ncbi:Peptidase C78 ubiquitin fold modifier-specific peptidase 1/ 2 [Macrophomina phaseolina MS6]|uniref:Peptidase C78 ubiquitin fold modifier-specific peptidase 1/ 2 n=1 Tax=Macrophomina phaseolina (strain MS6) TaxID=1126212 RepID=K2RMD0_MACPH|nr:Peptidase C78 ubiquitin fold modifier-specific peptidase 1/ 2 [Macrophomina phaseolina MS6]